LLSIRLTILSVAFLYIFIGIFVQEPKSDRCFEGQVTLTGVVKGLPTHRKDASLFKLYFIPNEGPLVDKKILLWWKSEDEMLRAGESWILHARLKPPTGWLNPNTFDYETYLYSQGVEATGYVLDSEPNLRLESPPNEIDRIRTSVKEQVISNYSENVAGIILALTVGDRSMIDESTWKIFIQTGTNHLLAISGLHISLIAGWIFVLARFFWGFKWSLMLSLIVAGFYASMAGFSIPTQRAWVMLLMVSVMLLSYRHWPFYFWISLTAIIVLLIDPRQVLSISFHLSFIAVIAIVWFSRNNERISFLNILYLQGFLSLIMGISTLLFIGNISFISPLANLITVPLYSFVIIPLTLIDSTIIYLTESAFPPFKNILEILIDISIRLLNLLLKFEPGYSFLGKANFWASVLCLFAIFWAFKHNKYRIITLFFCIAVLYPKYNKPVNGTAKYSILDVGQGQSILIETQHSTVLYDTGKKGRETQVIEPFLKGKGINQIDHLIISHDDNDHSGGSKGLINRLRVNKTHINQSCNSRWINDGVLFELTRLQSYTNDNDSSCILKVTPQYGPTLLVTGDLSKEGEQLLIATQTMNLKSDVLIAPHHGSKTSSSSAFIKQVAPNIVIFSSGFKNRFNHPHPDITARYQNLGIQGYSTRCSGMIQIEADETGKIQLSEYRKEKIWPWYRQCGDNEL
jgi:competence protein ComEC